MPVADKCFLIAELLGFFILLFFHIPWVTYQHAILLRALRCPDAFLLQLFILPVFLYKGKITSLRLNRSHLMALRLLLSQQMFTSMWSSQGPSWQSQPDPRSPSPSRSRNTREPGKLETWIEKRHNMKGGGRD